MDAFLPIYQFSERHACGVACKASRILDAVACYQPETDPFFRAVIALRELPMRFWRQHSERPEPFGLHNFTLLDRTEDEIVYGLAGQFWKANYGLYPVADGRAFQLFDQPQTAKLVLGFSVQHKTDGLGLLVTETRVFCPDQASRLKFTPYWLLIRPVSGLIRRRILSSIKKASEAPMSG